MTLVWKKGHLLLWRVFFKTGCSAADVRRAYRRLALLCHPDARVVKKGFVNIRVRLRPFRNHDKTRQTERA